jgi:Tfp pilus assembly protein PilV
MIKNLKNNTQKIKNSLRGFALVESLMAILIIMISIMAPLGLALQTVKYSNIAIEKMEATYIAEEAIEMIINLKKSAEIYCVDANIPECDNYFNNYFLDQSQSINNVISSQCYDQNYCNFDFSNFVYDSSSLSKTLKLQNIDSNKIYIQKNNENLSTASDIKSIFQRKINVRAVDLPGASVGSGVYNSVIVTSIVCIRENNTCDENSENVVIIKNLLSK